MKLLKENRIVLLLVIFQIVLIGFILKFGGTLTPIQMLMAAGIVILGIVIDIWVHISLVKIKEKDKLEQQMEIMRREQEFEQENLKNAKISMAHMEEKREVFYQALEKLYERCEEGGTTEEIRAAYDNTSQCLTNMKLVKYCDSPIINAVLTSKYEEAKAVDIDMKIAIDEITDYMRIERIDMCSVFCNLLDNAIEACQKVEAERYVHVRTQNKADYLTIVVENPSTGTLAKKDKGFLSTKANATEHGYGTKILSMIAEKYDGRFYLEEEAGKVKAVVLLKVAA